MYKKLKIKNPVFVQNYLLTNAAIGAIIKVQKRDTKGIKKYE